MGEVVSADVLDWARDLVMIQRLLNADADQDAHFQPKVVPLCFARRPVTVMHAEPERAIA
jgi:hypothetical protein